MGAWCLQDPLELVNMKCRPREQDMAILLNCRGVCSSRHSSLNSCSRLQLGKGCKSCARTIRPCRALQWHRHRWYRNLCEKFQWCSDAGGAQRLKVWNHLSIMVPVLFRFAPVTVGSLGNACAWAVFTGICSLWLNMFTFVVFIPSGCGSKGRIGLFEILASCSTTKNSQSNFESILSMHAIWSEFANERQVSICPIWSILIKFALDTWRCMQKIGHVLLRFQILPWLLHVEVLHPPIWQTQPCTKWRTLEFKDVVH